MIRRFRLVRSGTRTNEITIVISHFGFEARSGSHLRREWSKIHRVIEGDVLFLFVLSPGFGHFFPKDVLSTAEAEDLRQFLRATIGERAILLR